MPITVAHNCSHHQPILPFPARLSQHANSRGLCDCNYFKNELVAYASASYYYYPSHMIGTQRHLRTSVLTTTRFDGLSRLPRPLSLPASNADCKWPNVCSSKSGGTQGKSKSGRAETWMDVSKRQRRGAGRRKEGATAQARFIKWPSPQSGPVGCADKKMQFF